jgi:predicted nuclease of predicted toxin-antitoxin system
VRLLFDENLSFRLVTLLADLYPGSTHVREVGLLGSEDVAIWAYAAERGLLVTTKDVDFYERSVLHGAPPKVIWLRLGNRNVRETAELLRSQYIRIRRFSDDPEASFLSVSPL